MGSGSVVPGGGTGVKRLREHLFQLLPQDVEIDATGREHVPRLRLVGRRPEKVLEPDGIVTTLSRQAECALNGVERLWSEGNRRLGHYWFTFSVSGSIVTSSGNSCSSASSLGRLDLGLRNVVREDAGDAET